MDTEPKNVNVLIDRVSSMTCGQCRCEIDVSGLAAFVALECPSCGHAETVPAKLGQFLLLKLIGTGGMGGVYVAKDETLGRYVAIKVMLASLGENREFVETFKREAQAAAKLNHPNIAQIYSFGQEKGQPYIVMELVSGRSFDKMVTAEQPLDQALVLQIGMDIAEGLKAADEIGLVHGDIKPENILLDENANAKLVDFGIATFVHQASDGVIWGTPYYISPEKVQRRKADARSDIYSLGATLYHAFSGRPPFEGETPVEVVKARLGQSPEPLHTFREDIDRNVERVVARMLHPDPSSRYPTYASLLSDMSEALKGLNVDVKRRSAAGKRSKKVVIKTRRSVVMSRGAAGAQGTSAGRGPSSGELVVPKKTVTAAAPGLGSPSDEQAAEGGGGKKKGVMKVVLWLIVVLVVLLAGAGTVVALKVKRNTRIVGRREWFALAGARKQADEALQETQAAVTNILKMAAGTADYIPRARTAAQFVLEEPLGDPPEPKPPKEEEPAEKEESPADAADKPSAAGEAPAEEKPAEKSEGEPGGEAGAEPEENKADKAEAGPAEPGTEKGQADTTSDKPEEGGEKTEPAEQAEEEPAEPEEPVHIPEPRLLGWKVITEVRKIAQNETRAREIEVAALKARGEAASAKTSRKAKPKAVELAGMVKSTATLETETGDALKSAEEALAKVEKIKEKVQAEREAQRKAEQEAARRKAEQERERRERERRQALIENELELARAAWKDVVPLVKLQKYEEALRSLTVQKPKFQTDEGNEGLQVSIDRCERLQGLLLFLVKRLNARPFKWGWIQERSTEDIIGADKRSVKLRGRRVPWPEVGVRQMVQFIKKYVSTRDREVKPREMADQCLGAAIYCRVHGGTELAEAYAERATGLTPSLAREVKRLLMVEE